MARDLRDDDLFECLTINPGRIGEEVVGRARAVEIWKTLIRSRSFNSTVVEATRPLNGHRIMGFGAAVFVSRAFADAELSDPRPCINSRTIASIDSGRPVVLSEAELGSANARGGLDMVVLFASVRCDILDRDGISDAGTAMSVSFLEKNIGYRFHRLMMETVGPEEAALIEATHAYRFVRQFEELGHPTRRLWVLTREEAMKVTASMANPLFRYAEPILRLRDADQRLLLAALRGLTDEELSSALGISLTAVKKRWLFIFERTIDGWPDLFPATELQKDGRKRGRQKRHHVLAYLRAHPEELRPIEL